MKHFVERTCTVVRERAREPGRATESSLRHEADSKPLESFRAEPAYVLLGSPGSGKTKAFEREAEHEGVRPVSARDFQALRVKHDWGDKTLYIDGLDETRAGTFDGRTPLDAIRGKLQRLGYPRFRLSCREADWFGANDRERLKAVAPTGELLVLRLDPLSDRGILEILHKNLGHEDPKGFVDEARRLGVGGLLRNPLNLRMLAAAVAAVDDEKRPRTKTETFDMACRKLVSDENPEHRIAWSGTAAGTTALLDAAGDLCTILLLAGKAGVTLPGTAPDTDHPRLEDVPRGDQQVLRRVVSSNLFAWAAEGRLAPAHRHLAEFLAARRLERLIDEGLPVRRVLSLATGFDGGIISEFRGLAAWLAAWSKEVRPEIIERDPVAVLSGDIRDFAPDEKGWLFDSLGKEVNQHPWLLRSSNLVLQLGDLVVRELDDRFRTALANPPASEAAAAVARLVLRAFDGTEVPRGFDEELLSIVRDSRWQASIRYRALELYVRKRGRDENVNGRLLDALHHVYRREQDRVTRDELSGRLLAELYPSVISIARAAKYLRYPHSRAGYDSYGHFWQNRVVERSGPDQLLELLRFLRERVESAPDPWRPGPDGPDYPVGLPWLCLKALMMRSPSKLKSPMLYYWIGTGLSNQLVGLDIDSLVSWLSEHPGMRQALAQLAGRDDQPRRARDVAVVAIRAGHETDQLPDDLQIHFVAEPGHTARNPIHHDDGRDRPSLVPQFEAGLHELRYHMRSKLEDMRANRGPPGLLHNLAQAYLGRFGELWAPTGRERVSRMLGHQEDLVDSALAALMATITRSDLPTPTALERLTTEGRLHLLAHPVMAGMRERAKVGHGTEPPLNDQQARLAITIWYTTGEPPRLLRRSPGEPVPEDDLSGVPEWFTALTEARPVLAADVLVSVSRTLLRSGREPRHSFYGLVHPKEGDQLPRLATLRLLEVFPVRCHSRLLPHLRDLLVAACCHCDDPRFVNLIGNKLRYKSMSVGQRVYWLAVGQIVAPEQYSDRLESFAAGKETRIRHLTTMLIGQGGLPRRLEEAWDVPVLAPLIRLLGSSYRRTPELHTGVSYRVTLEMEASTYVNHLIDRLAMLPTEASTAALAELSASDSLGHWCDKLAAAAYRQRALRREAGFRHPSGEQVGQVLANRRPASAADLAALTTNMLRQVSERIRRGATSDWRQYWNVNKDNQAERPKPENGCRDALLSDLRQKLARLGIDATKEGSYADDKRSDIRVAYGGFNIPVEIKRSCHRALWSAIRSQLIANYTRDPDADGYGIYLVFWFGETEGCRPTPGAGLRPRSATELREALVDQLVDHEHRKISVCVIDVSKPDT